jgi:hypothetical protein
MGTLIAIEFSSDGSAAQGFQDSSSPLRICSSIGDTVRVAEGDENEIYWQARLSQTDRMDGVGCDDDGAWAGCVGFG